MSRHYLDVPLASDLSYQVFQRRNRPEQLQAAQFDNTRCVLKTVSGYDPRLFIADPDMDEPLPVSGHFRHGRKGQR